MVVHINALIFHSAFRLTALLVISTSPAPLLRRRLTELPMPIGVVAVRVPLAPVVLLCQSRRVSDRYGGAKNQRLDTSARVRSPVPGPS